MTPAVLGADRHASSTASQAYDARLFAELDALEQHPVIVRALDQAARLQLITDAAIAFARAA